MRRFSITAVLVFPAVLMGCIKVPEQIEIKMPDVKDLESNLGKNAGENVLNIRDRELKIENQYKTIQEQKDKIRDLELIAQGKKPLQKTTWKPFEINDIPRGGKETTVNFEQKIVANSVVVIVSSFDVKYTSGGGFKVQGVRASATAGKELVNEGKGVKIRCVCEIYDDDRGHDSRGQMSGWVMAVVAGP